MKAKDIASAIAFIIFGLIAVFMMVLILGAAFGADFATSIEWYVIKTWKWPKFNVILWSIVVLAIDLAMFIAMLVIQEDNRSKPVSRRRFN